MRRLTDPDVKKVLDMQIGEFMRDPQKAFAWLVKNGLLTPTGRLPKKYGGGKKKALDKSPKSV